jgi:hypothetical protein
MSTSLLVRATDYYRNICDASCVAAEARYDATLTGNLTLNATYPNILLLDPNGANRNVTWEDEDDAPNVSRRIANTAAAFNIVVKDNAGNTIATLLPGEAADFHCDGTDLVQTGGPFPATAGATKQIFDGEALTFGTPGTDVVMTADGADMVITGTGDVVFADSMDLYIGTGKDLRIYHDATNSYLTSKTGDLIIDNTLATGSTVLRLGTDTGATSFEVRNDSDAVLFDVLGSGAMSAAGPSFTHTATADADDFTFAQAGAFNASMFFTSTGTGADALRLNASAGGIDVNAAGAVDIAAGTGLDLHSGTTTSSWQHTADGAGDDLTISVLGAFNSSLFLVSEGTGADAIRMNASAGGMDVDAASTIDIASALGLDLHSGAATGGWTHTATADAQDLTIQVAGAFDVSLALASSGTGADAIDLNASAGGIDIDAAAAIDIAAATGLDLHSGTTTSGWTHTANGAGDDLTIQVAGAVDSSLFLVSAGTGADALRFNASAGGIDVDAAGDINVDAANLLLTATTDVQIGDAGNPTLTLAGTGNISVESDKRVVNAAAEVLLFDDDVFTIADPADSSKRASFDAGIVTAGQNRRIAVADRNQDMRTLHCVNLADPGTGNPIPVTDSYTVAFTIGGGAETNTLAAPTFIGQKMQLYAEVCGAGNRAVTVASLINQAGHNTITFAAVGDCIQLEAVQVAVAGTLRWRVAFNDGAATA